MYLYLKALHIIFIVTWFAGMFYMPRLFIYNVETQEQQKNPEVRTAMTRQFELMMRRLWRGITWPSAILTLIFGPSVMFYLGWDRLIFNPSHQWLLIKLIFVVGLYVYFLFLNKIFNQQQKGIYKYNSTQLRIWNEVATIFLVAIVFLVTVKSAMSLIYGVCGLIGFIIILMSAIKIYKAIRTKKQSSK